MKRILVTGAGGSAAANFVRSLRMAGEALFIAGADASRYHLELSDVDVRYLIPRAGDAAYLAEVNAVIDAERIEFVHAQPDPEVSFLARRRADVRARTFLPDPTTVALCQDKGRFATAVRDAGLPSPHVGSGESEDAFRRSVADIVATQGKAWVRATIGAGARASLPVETPDQAAAWVRYWIEMRGLSWSDFMVSEFLPGREFAFQSLWRDGELVTSQARERLEYLFGHLVPSGQTSTPAVARTVRRSDVNELAIAAIRAVDARANGVFCVDLKEDRTGRPLITEINAGRFFTTSDFFATAGLNMPYLYVKLAFGEPIPELPKTDVLEEGLYWVRMMDMGARLVRDGAWTSRTLVR